MGDHASRPGHPLPCAERVRLRRLLQAGDPVEPPVVVLHGIAREIHACCGHTLFKSHRLAWGLTVEQAVAAFHAMCDGRRIKRRGLSTRSWLEWEAGGAPNRDYQDLLSRLFSTSPVRLGFAADYTPAEADPVRPGNGRLVSGGGGGQWLTSARWDTHPRDAPVANGTGSLHRSNLESRVLSIDARIAARFARQITAGAVNDLTLEQIDAEVRGLARQYVSQPLSALFLDIRELRSDVVDLIENNRYPEQIRHLHLAASRLCGLQAHVCLDLGHYAEADTLARTAWLCADLAGHSGMRGWVRGLQSLIAYWDGRLVDAAGLAADGAGYISDGSITVRLAALQARAAAGLGDRATALGALESAQIARGRLRADDEVGGVFTFPEAKQAAYAGTTLLTLDGPDLAVRAVAESSRAIELYETAAPLDRSSGDLLAAHLDLAVAHLAGDDLDGTHAELAVVRAPPPERRTASIRTRATALAVRLTEPRCQTASLARQMREAIDGFCVPPPACPPDPRTTTANTTEAAGDDE